MLLTHVNKKVFFPETRESRLWREFARSTPGEQAPRSPSGECEPNRALCARNGFATGQQKEDGVACATPSSFW